MKKVLTILIILAVSLSLLITFSIPVFADSPEVLTNPGFEEDMDGWVHYVKATLEASDAEHQAGDYSCHAADKYSNSDGPRQDITDKISFYGKGQYKISAYMLLDGTVSTATAQIVVQTQSSDKTFGSKDYPGQMWYLTEFATVNDKTWTKIEGTIDLSWAGDLVMSEFYFVVDPADGAGMEPYYIDSCSMVKVGYTGAAFSEPTEAPTVTPTIAPTPTIMPTASPTKVPVVTPTNTPAPSPIPATTKDNISPVLYIGFGAAVLLIGGGVAVLLLDKKKKGPLVEDLDKTEKVPK